MGKLDVILHTRHAKEINKVFEIRLHDLLLFYVVLF